MVNNFDFGDITPVLSIATAFTSVVLVGVKNFFDFKASKDRLRFDYKTRFADKFREKFALLLSTLDSMFILVERNSDEFDNLRMTINEIQDSNIKDKEKFKSLIYEYFSCANFLCLMIEDDKTQREFECLVESIFHSMNDTQIYNKKSIELTKMGQLILKKVDYQIER